MKLLPAGEKPKSGDPNNVSAGNRASGQPTVPLGDGKDYIDKSHEIALPLTEKAISSSSRGQLSTSGLILITPLEIEGAGGLAVSGGWW